ncbi:MAG TPA: TIGR03936 family radical SAM-associated protein [Anaerovoracaceae bacterium]|nr:TIGR03936 family radical SAM-associated protein [Anaerovoracaceae bacterium]
MNRYLLRFEKLGALRYTSHLDLLRLFRRTFKRAGVELQYSRGFNPLPKIGFAQPLSLGYTSISEYLEFETAMSYNEKQVIGLMNSSLPYGIRILNCRIMSDSEKSIASSVRLASYEVSMPEEYSIPTAEQIEAYLDMEKIIVSKPVKKRREVALVDIKPMIKSLSYVEKDGIDTILMKINTGSQSNLNPELLLISLYDFCKLPFQKGVSRIKRLELFKEDGESLF